MVMSLFVKWLLLLLIGGRSYRAALSHELIVCHALPVATTLKISPVCFPILVILSLPPLKLDPCCSGAGAYLRRDQMHLLV